MLKLLCFFSSDINGSLNEGLNLGDSDERITESGMVRDSHTHLKVSELLYLQSAFT